MTTLANKESRFEKSSCMSRSTNTRRIDDEQGSRGNIVVVSLYIRYRAKVILMVVVVLSIDTRAVLFVSYYGNVIEAARFS